MLCTAKVDGESGTIQIAVMNKDDQIFKSWFASHIRVQMSGGKKEITDLKKFHGRKLYNF